MQRDEPGLGCASSEFDTKLIIQAEQRRDDLASEIIAQGDLEGRRTSAVSALSSSSSSSGNAKNSFVTTSFRASVQHCCMCAKYLRCEGVKTY